VCVCVCGQDRFARMPAALPRLAGLEPTALASLSSAALAHPATPALARTRPLSCVRPASTAQAVPRHACHVAPVITAAPAPPARHLSCARQVSLMMDRHFIIFVAAVGFAVDPAVDPVVVLVVVVEQTFMPGAYCNGSELSLCPSGTYAPSSGSVSVTACLACPAGHACSQPGIGSDLAAFPCPPVKLPTGLPSPPLF
jgi:hypothetical protein